MFWRELTPNSPTGILMYLGDVKVTGASQVEENWEQLKIRENNGYKPVLSGVPASLPAIVKDQQDSGKSKRRRI